MWLSIYPFMDKRSFISFEDYKARIVRPRVTEMIDTQQVLRDVAAIRDQLRKEGLHGDL